ncbi:zinc finger translocation-associated protein [Candoia aspera]|uniref:zinc finger translocation-associated protein n=1 Tax=Candoia aspera TaxID=51853 RepID=UPI002FD84FF7
MEPPRLSIKQEPLDAGDSMFPEGAFESQNSGESSSGRLLRPSGNGLLRGIAKKDPVALLAGGRKYSDHCEARASRPGKSRIPGRDHRRYYHEHWRAEYLMDFNAARHGMICMVCGSSLATLKLSTIKRHIRQKHPYSLAWSAHEKEVIMNSWDAHLGLEVETDGTRDSAKRSGASPADHGELLLDGGRRRRHGPGPLPSRGGRRPSSLALKSSSEGESQSLEQYLKQSLQSWFQCEFLMDYDPQGNRLFCMMCGSSLPSLNLDDIKRHVMDAHPTSLGFSPAEKGAILEAWNSRALVLAAEGRNAGGTAAETGTSTQRDLNVKELDSSASPDHPTAEDGIDEAGPWDSEESSPRAPARGRDHRRYFQEHWRVEYLMDYNGVRHGLVCMVCGSTLATLKMSTIKRHIQQKHPDSTQLSHQVKALIVQEWSQKVARLADAEDSQPETDAEVDQAESQRVYKPPASPKEPPEDLATAKREEDAPAADRLALSQPSPGAASLSTGTPSRRSQRRNYQPRWRVQYLMDYDEQKHGLICMVCGGTLATLKVSTIKRHILQVHRFSLEYTELEKQTILDAYGENDRVSNRQEPGPKATAAGADSESQDVKPNVEEARKMALGYKLSVCAV